MSPKETNSTINIKTSTAIAGLGAAVIGLLGWTLVEIYEGVDKQLSIQWGKINQLEKDVATIKATIEHDH